MVGRIKELKRLENKKESAINELNKYHLELELMKRKIRAKSELLKATDELINLHLEKYAECYKTNKKYNGQRFNF